MMTNNRSTTQQSYFQVFNIFQIIFAVDLDEFDCMIKRLFSYRHLYQASVDISPRLRLGQMLGLDIGADMKTAVYDNL